MLTSDSLLLWHEIECDRLLAEKKAQEKAALEANKAAVQERLADIVKQAAGWTTLDPWAQDALDAVKNNKIVNLDKLDADIQAWVAAQGQ